MGEIADKLASMKKSNRVKYLGNLRSLVDANTIEGFNQFFQLLTDYDFIEVKINHPKFGVQSLIENYELIENKSLADTQDNHQKYNTKTLENLKIIKQALQLSAHVINQDTKQLAGQLTGRLLPFENRTTIQKLLKQISQTKVTWLRPLTASLTPPGNGLIRTLTGHSGWVSAVAVSSDGKYIVSGSSDKTIKIWEFATGKELRTLTGHSSYVDAVVLSSDGKYIVSASDDKTIKIWEFSTGKETYTLTGHNDSVNVVAVSSDNKYVVSGSNDNTIKIWELVSGNIVHTLTGHSSFVNTVAISSDDKYIISASSDETIKIWEFATQKEIYTLIGHSSPVIALALSSDDKYILSSSYDNIIKVWEFFTGKEIVTFTGEGHINCCAITLDNATIIAGDESGKVHFLRLEGIQV